MASLGARKAPRKNPRTAPNIPEARKAPRGQLMFREMAKNPKLYEKAPRRRKSVSALMRKAAGTTKKTASEAREKRMEKRRATAGKNRSRLTPEMKTKRRKRAVAAGKACKDPKKTKKVGKKKCYTRKVKGKDGKTKEQRYCLKSRCVLKLKNRKTPLTVKKHKQGRLKGKTYVSKNNKLRTKRPLSNYQKHMQAFAKRAHALAKKKNVKLTPSERKDIFRTGASDWKDLALGETSKITKQKKTAPKYAKGEFIAIKKKERAQKKAATKLQAFARGKAVRRRKAAKRKAARPLPPPSPKGVGDLVVAAPPRKSKRTTTKAKAPVRKSTRKSTRTTTKAKAPTRKSTRKGKGTRKSSRY